MAASLIPAASKGWNSSTVQEFRIPGTRLGAIRVHPLQEMGKIGTSAEVAVAEIGRDWQLRKSEINENDLPASSQTVHFMAEFMIVCECSCN